MIPKIDLLLWSSDRKAAPPWSLGNVGYLDKSVQAAQRELDNWVEESTASYLLLWTFNTPLPDVSLLLRFIEEGIDLAHCGLKLGTGDLLSSLHLIKHDWSMINGPVDQPSSSWRLNLDRCLIRQDLILQVGGIDAAFISRAAAGLDLGLRCMKLGALVEHRPELWHESTSLSLPEVPEQDLYTFVLRHYGKRWAQYVLVRRGMRGLSWFREQRCYRQSLSACVSNPSREKQPVWFHTPSIAKETLKAAGVSVIVPTLGRYPYLPGALASLQRQTVQPREVIVIDQNPPEQRQPQTYEGYDELNLRVVWQDESGQSLARNMGFAVANSPYVFLFDDDSIADDDLIENHLRYIIGSRFHISTGISLPPTPSNYEVPANFRYLRLSQTFDTGNCLLPLSVAKEIGGLDRNYDFGPGTDTDFGTRLYLEGYRILHNPDARRIHFKAPMGGLRTHGAHKYNTDKSLLGPFPPVTQSYYGLRYLNRWQQRERAFLQFATDKIPRGMRHGRVNPGQLKAFVAFLLRLILLPMKHSKSQNAARAMLKQGKRLTDFFRHEDNIRVSQ